MIRKNIFYVLMFTFCVFNQYVWADIISGVPKNPGSALILYNAHRSIDNFQRQFDHSVPTMQIFRAALDPDNSGSFLQPSEHANVIRDGIPPMTDLTGIKWPLTMVTVLDIGDVDSNGKAKSRQSGIDTYLRAWANTNLSGREREIFDELYDAGNPLSYWSQVYDLRYIQEYWNQSATDYTDLSLITTSGSRNDLEYFKVFLQDGGGLYIQAASKNYEKKNERIAETIRALTKDKTFNRNRSDAEIQVTENNFWFNNSSESEYFATDFNNLNVLQNNPQYAMRWVRAGGIKLIASDYAIPLVNVRNANDSSMIVFWDKDGLDEAYKNGRLIVSYAITAWMDHVDGSGTGQLNQGAVITSRTTAALVQNLYDLMSGTQRYTISKSFVPDERKVGENGIVRIAVRNPNNYPFKIGEITDELSTCLRFVRDDKHSFIDQVNGHPTPAQATQTQNGRTLKWELNSNDGHIPARSDWVIEFEYMVDNADCGN